VRTNCQDAPIVCLISSLQNVLSIMVGVIFVIMLLVRDRHHDHRLTYDLLRQRPGRAFFREFVCLSDVLER
jgi:hypothetical protein